MNVGDFFGAIRRRRPPHTAAEAPKNGYFLLLFILLIYVYKTVLKKENIKKYKYMYEISKKKKKMKRMITFNILNQSPLFFFFSKLSPP